MMSKEPRFYMVECLWCGRKWIRKARKYQRLKDVSFPALDVCDDCVAHPRHRCGNKMQLVRLAQHGNKPFFVCENCEVGYDALLWYETPYLRKRVEELIKRNG